MAIIVEGFDNSGKSTLAASFGLEIVHPGPRPVTLMEEMTCLNSQSVDCTERLVMDRVTSISSPCYTGHFKGIYRRCLDSMLSKPHCVLIYCRPPIEVIKDFSNHIAKSYDDETKIKWLHDNAEAIVSRYDLYMSVFPHIKFDYTKPDEGVRHLARAAQSSTESWNRWKSLTQR